MFLYGLRDSTQCILIDISISCYQFFVVYLIVDVKINLIQCQCQCHVSTCGMCDISYIPVHERMFCIIDTGICAIIMWCP